MKELTIEEKAARYDEAINIARKINSGEGVAAPSGWTTCEVIFPELKESEDEKIRKALLRFHKSTIDIDGIKGGDILAWLEKQGEPKEINPSEFDSQLNRLLGQFKSLPKEELASSLSFYLNVVQNDGTYKEEKQGEQKPAEWSEEDEYMIKNICNAFEKDSSQYIWLKSLKERYTWKPSDEQIRTLDFAIDCTVYPEFNIHRSVLKELLEQLKKLREE